MRLFPFCLFLPLLFSACERHSSVSSWPRTQESQGGDWFKDITAQSGIQFAHVAGTNYFMPDQVGSGVALFDFDRDGRLDVYLVQNGGTNHPAPNQLFHQEPDGTFKNVSAGSGLDIVGRGMGAFAGDLNNDGLPELLVTEYGAVHLFLNLGGGKFKEITREAGLENPRWAAPASFIDYDRDGWLDIVVGNYIDYDPTHVCLDVQGRQEFCAPKAFADTVTRLWHNKTKERGGLPEFEDRTEASGLTHAPGAALGLVCADFDGDGWPDIFCSDDTRANRLFVNRHNGTFTEQAAARGLAFNAMGATAANMGTAFGDVDGDGLPDLFITHLTEEFHGLWKQGPRGVFSDSVALAGLQRQSWRGTGFGTVLADFDCDGDADLVFLNGLVRRAAPGQTPVLAGVDSWWARYAQKAQIFSNNGKGEFSDSSSFNQSLCGQAIIGRSLAVGDLNNDGAMDLVLCSASGPVRVLQNTAPHRGHWLRLQLVDPAHGDRDEIGAEAVVEAAGRKWWALLQPATSYLASNDPVLHFGLADKSNLERITILWPDGVREVFPGGQADRLLTLHKGVGQKSPGATP